ncbi:MAG: class I SAM-dependent methyltransferase [Desulfuromonadales bacterium]|nr:class I SAM-dependent methyltransferase [Desulfuromonadales bacterium]
MPHTLLDIIKQNLPDASPDARRLFHGRGQTVAGLEAVTLDWYPPLLVLTLYADFDEKWLQQLSIGLQQLFEKRLGCLVCQQRRTAGGGGRILYGRLPEQSVAQENGLRYLLDPLAHQNIGIFPDMAVGRAYLRTIAEGKSILNLFAYTCGFSVAALAGGAKKVVNLDMNRRLLERGRQNHRLNEQDLRSVVFLGHDLFKSFGRLKREGPFDLIILDPPFFQSGSFSALRDWPKMLRRLPELLTDSGELLAAVSAPELGANFLRQQIDSAFPGAQILARLTGGADFPEQNRDKGLHLLHVVP